MIFFIIQIIIFFSAIIIHEYSHGWVAYKLGDPTAKYAGRLTLNPLAHIDPIGTLILPITLRLMGSPIVFGWAKPVPVNFRNLKNPKRDMIWVGLAGPAANFIFAIILSLVLKIKVHFLIYQIIELGILINLVLAIFNLIPIPPLDGSRILIGLLPHEYALRYSKIEPYGFLIVIFLLSIGLFNKLILPILIILANFLGLNF